MNCWKMRNTSLHGETILESAHMQLHQSKVRIAEAYENDKNQSITKHKTLFDIQFQEQLQQQTI